MILAVKDKIKKLKQNVTGRLNNTKIRVSIDKKYNRITKWCVRLKSQFTGFWICIQRIIVVRSQGVDIEKISTCSFWSGGWQDASPVPLPPHSQRLCKL